MNDNLIQENSYFRTVIDTIPIGIFLIDDGYNINGLNPSATEIFKLGTEGKLHRLCGEVLNCKNAIESDEGCGTTKMCPECVLRNSVESACMGEKTHKKKYKMTIEFDGRYLDLHMLVSASPFEYEGEKLALVAIEDITEVVSLKRLLPICSRCKKIRSDKGYWEEVADYLKRHADLDFTHGICPECLHKLYPDIVTKT